jgi:hypothetical protein
MGKVDIEILLDAVDKGFRADSTATLGDSVREARKYLEEMTEDANVI